MNKSTRTILAAALASFCLTAGSIQAQHQAQNITIQVSKPTAEVKPTMWGLFFEDINFAADGGLYAELVKNRSFEFDKPLMGWKEVKQNGGGTVLIINRTAANDANPRFARLTVDAENGTYGLLNEGFRGMGIEQGKQYNFSVLARQQGKGNLKMRLELVNEKGDKLGKSEIGDLTPEWKKHTISFKATATAPKANFQVLLQGKGVADLDMISLFPQDTWKNRPNGLRKDLVQMLADIKPGFLRFPGGCIVEGKDLANRYQWKKTVGDVEDRTLIMNRWNVEFAHRNAPDYFQSYGLGFYEYFLLAEDLGAAPLPILNCGMACQYNTGEVVAMDELDPYLQDALDLIAFANGPVTSKWGKLRADMGHPAPFNLKLLGIGNEQWDEQYIERYRVFEEVLKKQHPEIMLISTSGPSAEGPRFDYLWSELKTSKADYVDEHYYKSPEWFLENATRYDNYDRTGPKVFAGEYAAHGKEEQDPESRNTWYSAMAEAAFMTGLERNADVVHLASYAPLLAHVEAWQWRPDMIWFDNLRAVGTPNYYVQKLFGANSGTHVVPALRNGAAVTGQDSLYASSTIDRKTNEVIVKLVNTSKAVAPVSVSLEGATIQKRTAALQVLKAANPMDYNTLDKPQVVVPTERKHNFSGNTIALKLEPQSVTVVKMPCKKL
ncbi:alpha-L-arabinofuranosidase C-terminal domain-containing protein [Pontibacter sp. 13R65]|uniref:alpha-L-arabinofuranosidase C-terminal domain-containing protein n=1 Tax=Pontibacter sp. 13R65 TaxID=3127458 RepID=UPI00301BFF62